MARVLKTLLLLVFLNLSSTAKSEPLEDIWIVDNSPRSTAMMIEVIDHIETYFIELRSANVQSSGLFLTADALRNYMNPFQSEWGDVLLTTEQGDVTPDWSERTADAWVRYPDVSPIWVLEMFYRRLPALSLFTKGIHMPKVPTNVTIFSAWDDGFHKYTLGGPQEFWGPEDFVHSFQNIYGKSQKPYTINAVVRVRKDKEAPPGGIDMVYEQITHKTGGTLYPWEPGKSMNDIMRQLAKKAIERARASR